MLKQGLRQRIIDFEENERQKLLELIQADGHLLESKALEGTNDKDKVSVSDCLAKHLLNDRGKLSTRKLHASRPY